MMFFRPLVIFVCVAAVTACAPVSGPDRAGRLAIQDDIPAISIFAPHLPVAPQRSNAGIARDFLDLTFQMESGRQLPVMTRFEGPITLRVTGDNPPTLSHDLGRLLSRLRTEAGINITRVGADSAASITIEAVPQAQLQRLFPHAACFVVPRVSSLAEFRANRRSRRTDWTTLESRQQVAIFVPSDVSPQELRDCLHEELAQALGPLNDLYRLPDSVFNDDNFHNILTGFDMLVLRLTYAPELRSGMTRATVAARLPALLMRMNPAGVGGTFSQRAPTPRSWIDAIESALGAGANTEQRVSNARLAVNIARTHALTDNRLAFSLYAYGRLLTLSDPERAIAAFMEANSIYQARPETRLHSAHIEAHLALFALSRGDAELALRAANSAIPTATASENASLLATLLMIRSEALDLSGRTSDARAVRLDSLGWARYGFGSEANVRARLESIERIAQQTARLGG